MVFSIEISLLGGGGKVNKHPLPGENICYISSMLTSEMLPFCSCSVRISKGAMAVV